MNEARGLMSAIDGLSFRPGFSESSGHGERRVAHLRATLSRPAVLISSSVADGNHDFKQPAAPQLRDLFMTAQGLDVDLLKPISFVALSSVARCVVSVVSATRYAAAGSGRLLPLLVTFPVGSNSMASGRCIAVVCVWAAGITIYSQALDADLSAGSGVELTAWLEEFGTALLAISRSSHVGGGLLHCLRFEPILRPSSGVAVVRPWPHLDLEAIYRMVIRVSALVSVGWRDIDVFPDEVVRLPIELLQRCGLLRDTAHLARQSHLGVNVHMMSGVLEARYLRPYTVHENFYFEVLMPVMFSYPLGSKAYLGGLLFAEPSVHVLAGEVPAPRCVGTIDFTAPSPMFDRCRCCMAAQKRASDVSASRRRANLSSPHHRSGRQSRVTRTAARRERLSSPGVSESPMPASEAVLACGAPEVADRTIVSKPGSHLSTTLSMVSSPEESLSAPEGPLASVVCSAPVVRRTSFTEARSGETQDSGVGASQVEGFADGTPVYRSFTDGVPCPVPLPGHHSVISTHSRVPTGGQPAKSDVSRLHGDGPVRLGSFFVRDHCPHPEYGLSSLCRFPGCGACVPGNDLCELEHVILSHGNWSDDPTAGIFVLRDLYVLDLTEGPVDRYQICCALCGNFCGLQVVRGVEPRLSRLLAFANASMRDHQVQSHRHTWDDLLTPFFESRTDRRQDLMICTHCGHSVPNRRHAFLDCLVHLARDHESLFATLLGSTPIASAALRRDLSLSSYS